MADPKNLSPVKEAEKKYLEALGKDLTAWEKKEDAKELDRKAQKKLNQYKICQLIKAKNTNELYTALKYYITDGSSKESELIKAKVGVLNEINASLTTALTETIGLIKETRKQMTEAVEIACKLPRSITEEKRCNLDIYVKLEKEIKNNVWDRVKALKKDTNEGFTKITTATNVNVDLIGIQNLAKTDSLDSYSDALIECMNAFKEDVEANITSSQENLDSVSKEFSTELENLAQVRVDHSTIGATVKSKEMLKSTIESPACGKKLEGAVDRIKEICDAFYEIDGTKKKKNREQSSISEAVVIEETKKKSTPTRKSGTKGIEGPKDASA